MPKRPASSPITATHTSSPRVGDPPAPTVPGTTAPTAGDPPAPNAPSSDGDVVRADQPRAAGRPRRRFTVEQKRAILSEAERCTERGDLGALLRGHGLYSATLTKWRQAFANASLRGPGRPAKHDEKDKQINELHRRVERLEAQNKRAQGLIDLQKKALALVEAATAVSGIS